MTFLAEVLRRLRVMREPDWGMCRGCGCAQTSTDRKAGYCTQCKRPIERGK